MIKLYKENDMINFDSGTFFARGVFETILIKEKGVFLKKHVDRLNRGLKKLKINQNLEVLDIEKFILENKLKDCILKIIVTSTNVIGVTRKNTYTEREYKEGFKLAFSNVRRNTTSIYPYIKSVSYIENILEREASIEKGCNDAIFLNEKGYIAECSTSNIFFVKGKKIYTPSIENGLLDGTIRDWVVENFDVIECSFKKSDLLKADEVFITNAIVGIMKVKSIEEVVFNDNLIIEIQRKYNKVIEEF